MTLARLNATLFVSPQMKRIADALANISRSSLLSAFFCCPCGLWMNWRRSQASLLRRFPLRDNRGAEQGRSRAEGADLLQRKQRRVSKRTMGDSHSSGVPRTDTYFSPGLFPLSQELPSCRADWKASFPSLREQEGPRERERSTSDRGSAADLTAHAGRSSHIDIWVHQLPRGDSGVPVYTGLQPICWYWDAPPFLGTAMCLIALKRAPAVRYQKWLAHTMSPKGNYTLKGIIHPKMKIRFQTCMHFFQLLNTKEDILKNVGNSWW